MTQVRYLLMAMPPPQTLQAMQLALERFGLDRQLGAALFKSSNWHQSLSDRHWEGERPDLIERLVCAGFRISSQAIALRLNRIAGKGGHWAFKARGKPAGFAELLLAVVSQ